MFIWIYKQHSLSANFSCFLLTNKYVNTSKKTFAVNRLILLPLPTQNLSCSVDIQCYSLNLSLSEWKTQPVPNAYSLDIDLTSGLRYPTLNNLEQNNLNKHFIRFIYRPAQVFFKTLSIKSGNEPASFQLCCQALYRMRLVQVKNRPRANVSPAGEANLVQAMYRSLERSPRSTRDGFDL